MPFQVRIQLFERYADFSDLGMVKMSARSERHSQIGEREGELRSEKSGVSADFEPCAHMLDFFGFYPKLL